MERKNLYPFTMGIRENDSCDQHKINFVLDISDLDINDMGEWLANTTSPKVKIASEYRPLGDAELKRLAEKSKTSPIVYKLGKVGMKKDRTVDYKASLVRIFGEEKAELMINKFGSAKAAAEALAAIVEVNTEVQSVGTGTEE